MYRVKTPATQTPALEAEAPKEALKADESVVVDTSLFAQEAVAAKYQPKEKKEKPVKEIKEIKEIKEKKEPKELKEKKETKEPKEIKEKASKKVYVEKKIEQTEAVPVLESM